MCKVYTGYNGTREIEHGFCAPVWSIIPSLKLGDYLSVQAHKPCSISHMSYSRFVGISRLTNKVQWFPFSRFSPDRVLRKHALASLFLFVLLYARSTIPTDILKKNPHLLTTGNLLWKNIVMINETSNCCRFGDLTDTDR